MGSIITVFGGAGFLGSHVSDQLSKLGHLVRVFDQVQSPWIGEDQEMMIGDILDPRAVSKAIAGADTVFNFAGISDLEDGLDKPLPTIEANIHGNALLMASCVQHQIRQFVYASTVYVEGSHGGFYRCSKAASELYVEEFKKSYDLDYAILRYGSLYGSRAPHNNGLRRIIQRALETGKVEYEGDAGACREYIHVEDAARASALAMSDKFLNKCVTITGATSTKVTDLLEMLNEILGYEDPVRFITPKRRGHYKLTPVTHDKSHALKYSPEFHVDLGQGMAELIREISQDG